MCNRLLLGCSDTQGCTARNPLGRLSYWASSPTSLHDSRTARGDLLVLECVADACIAYRVVRALRQSTRCLCSWCWYLQRTSGETLPKKHKACFPINAWPLMAGTGRRVLNRAFLLWRARIAGKHHADSFSSIEANQDQMNRHGLRR